MVTQCLACVVVTQWMSFALHTFFKISMNMVGVLFYTGKWAMAARVKAVSEAAETEHRP